MNKKTTILSKAITTVIALAACATSAHAASFVNGTTGAGELFIGFHATGGTGSGQSVVIDVGSVSALSALATGSTQSLGTAGTDLVAAFGANWFNRSDVLWGAVAGVQNVATADPTSTLYGGVSGTGAFPLSSVGYTRGANGAQSTVAGRILTMANSASGSFATATQGASSNIAQETSADGNSWASWMPSTSNNNVTSLGNLQFGGFGAPSAQPFEQAFAAGTLASGFEGALDVYRMFKNGVADSELANATSGPGSYQGTVVVNSSGDFTFEVQPVAVPEPASIGALTSAALMGIGLIRRKRVARA